MDTDVVPQDEEMASVPNLDVPPEPPDGSVPAPVRAPRDAAPQVAQPMTEEIIVEEPSHEPRGYPSLYDTKISTIVAVFLGIAIVGGIQLVVHNIHKNAKTDYNALTQFVTMMVALVLGAYMADLLIAGPDTSLLSDDEHTIILGFVKDICLMVFSYYFGTRSASRTEPVE